MNCRQVQDNWHDACDVGSDLTPELEAHLHHCNDCRRYVRQMSRLTESLDELRDATAEIVSRSGLTRCDVTIRRAIPLWQRMVHASMRVAAVLVIVVGAGLYLRHRQPTTSVVEGPRRTMPAIRHVSLQLRGSSDKAFLAVREETLVDIGEPVDVIWLYRLPPQKSGGNGPPRSSTEDSRKEKRT